MSLLIKSVGILFTIYLVPNPYPQQYAGSGFIFKYDNSYFIATCRHCIDNFDLPGFVLELNSNSHSDINNKNIQIVTQKKDYFFSPHDTDSTSYDIAIFRIGHPKNIFEKYEIWPITLPTFKSLPKLNLGDSLIVVGYPQSKIDKRVINSDTISLEPYLIKGEFIYSYPKSNVKADGCKRLLHDQFFIKINNSDDLTGISGSLVLLVRENNYYPIGIVTSSGTGIYMSENVNTIGFTPIGRIYETIGAL